MKADSANTESVVYEWDYPFVLPGLCDNSRYRPI